MNVRPDQVPYRDLYRILLAPRLVRVPLPGFPAARTAIRWCGSQNPTPATVKYRTSWRLRPNRIVSGSEETSGPALRKFEGGAFLVWIHCHMISIEINLLKPQALQQAGDGGSGVLLGGFQNAIGQGGRQ